MPQTRIAPGTSYWMRFLERFPTVDLLAAADEDEVLRLWQGLGYYSRARNLHAAARQSVAMGGFPRTLDGIRALKGVGDYTAAAIASIAFGVPAAVVDGNVYRVLSRVYGIETPIGTPAARKKFTDLAQSLLPADRPGDFNEAMMDFGATQCTPAGPDCASCPLQDFCVAYRTHRVGDFPVKAKGPSVHERRFTYIYVRVGEMTAFHKRPAGDIWQGLWEPYWMESGTSECTFPDWTGEGKLTLIKEGVRHQLTHQRLTADFYLFESRKRPPLPEDYRWMNENELDHIGKPRLVERLLAAVTPFVASNSF